MARMMVARRASSVRTSSCHVTRSVHLESGGGNSPCIRGLARGEQYIRLLEDADGLRRARDVGALTHRKNTVLHQCSSILSGKLVLSR